MDGWLWLVFTVAGAWLTATADIPDTTTTALLTTADPDHSTTAQSPITVTPEGTTTTTITPEGTTTTTITPEGTTTTTITPEGTTKTTITPEGTTTTITPKGTTATTIPPEGTTTTIPPEGTTTTITPEGTTTIITPEDTTTTTITPEGTTTTITPEGTTISTSTPDGTTVTPEGTTTITLTPESTTTTTVTPEGTTTTITPEGTTITTVTPEGTTITTSTPDGTTVTPEGTTTITLIPESTTTTTVTPEGTTTTTSTPDGTTVIPEGTTTTITPDGTTVTPQCTTTTTSTPDGTTGTPEGTTTTTSTSDGTTVTTTVPSNTTFSNTSTSSTTPQGTVPTTGSEGTSITAFATSEYPETTATSTSPVLTTTDFTNTDTSATPITDTTLYPITTTSASTNTTSIATTATSLSTDNTLASTTFYPTTENAATYSTTPTTPTDASTASLYTNTTLPSTTNTTITPENPTTYTTPTTASPTDPNTTATSFPTIPNSITTPYNSPSTTTITTVTTTTTTTSPTTLTLPTTTALKCYNGGKIVNGVCICPDAWTGYSCAVVNFCEAQRLDGFSFAPTPIGWFAYSKEKCEAGTSGTGKPQASTRCLLMKKSPRFSPPKIFQCDLTLSDIQNFTSANLETVATSAQILTSNPDELTAENVTAAAQIANTLLLSANATESVTVAAVATISQLLNATMPEDAKENTPSLGLTLTLDQLSVNLSFSLHTSQSQVVQPNLVVQSAQLPAADTRGVQFTSFRGTSGSFVANRIQLNTNATQIEVDHGFIADALIYLRFPPGEGVRGGQTNSNVSLGFVLYQNDRFFHSKLYTRRRANIRVLSASVKGQEGPVVPEHVEMLFSPRLMDGTSLYDFSCVFWNYSLKDWSTAGCSKGNASDGLVRCFCNHTTNFAALWSYRENYEYAEALGVISIVGLCASILGLAVTIIHHVKENFHRKSRDLQSNLNSKLALLCIYLSLLAFIITFLSGVQNSSRHNDAELQIHDQANHLLDSDERVEPDRGSCTAVAALLHFLLMATFTWTSVYATQLVLLVRSLRRSLPARWTPLSLALGFGVPACLVAITLGVTYRVDRPLGYRQEEFCWLAALDKNKEFSFGKPMFWGFLLPVGLILTYNLILLVLISMTTCKADPKLTSNKDSSLRKKLLVSVSLAVLLGLSWTLGYLVLLSSGNTHLVFSILFCLCTTTQGLQIFILFTARTRTFRVIMSRSVQYTSTVSIPLSSTKYRLRKTWDTNQSETYRDLSDGDTITSNSL